MLRFAIKSSRDGCDRIPVSLHVRKPLGGRSLVAGIHNVSQVHAVLAVREIPTGFLIPLVISDGQLDVI